MTPFEKALANYRGALEAAAATAKTVSEQGLYRIHLEGLELIERHYAETKDPKWCWTFIKSEQILHQGNILKGDAVPALRSAFERLVHIAESESIPNQVSHVRD